MDNLQSSYFAIKSLLSGGLSTVPKYEIARYFSGDEDDSGDGDGGKNHRPNVGHRLPIPVSEYANSSPII